MTFEFLFPIIDREFDTRLFDAALIDAIEASDAELSETVASIEKDLADPDMARMPGYRADLERRLEMYKGWAAEAAANPFASLPFAEKVARQLGYVAPMPNFKATDEERKAELAAYTRYVNRVTAEAEIIELWRTL